MGQRHSGQVNGELERCKETCLRGYSGAGPNHSTSLILHVDLRMYSWKSSGDELIPWGK